MSSLPDKREPSSTARMIEEALLIAPKYAKRARAEWPHDQEPPPLVAESNLATHFADALVALASRSEGLLEAIVLLHDNFAEYQRINHIGGYDNHDMVLARAAIAKARGERADAVSEQQASPSATTDKHFVTFDQWWENHGRARHQGDTAHAAARAAWKRALEGLHDIATPPEETSKWIPVEERVPAGAYARNRQSADVLVRYMDNGSDGPYYAVACYWHDIKRWESDTIEHFFEYHTVTHWQELPPGPSRTK